jgi:hypothetical protein
LLHTSPTIISDPLQLHDKENNVQLLLLLLPLLQILQFDWERFFFGGRGDGEVSSKNPKEIDYLLKYAGKVMRWVWFNIGLQTEEIMTAILPSSANKKQQQRPNR